MKEYYDSITLNTMQTTSPLPSSPAENTRSKRPNAEDIPLPARKKRLSFQNDQQQKMNVQLIEEELAAFALRQCCVRLCWAWLTVQMIMYCRAMFVLLPTYEARRQWLEAEYERMKKNETCYCYNIDVLGTERKVCCKEAWMLSYGISEGTHKKHRKSGVQARQRVNNKKKSQKVGSQAKTGATVFFIVWLIAFANKVGDKLPFGDSSVNKTEIRLPYPSKTMVYDIYKNFVENKDTTSTDKPLSLAAATRTWKHDEELRHIKLAKYKEGFSKCDVCCQYAIDSSLQMTAAEREALDIKFYSHICETRKERTQYYASKCKALLHPEDCLSLIMDAMDQRKTAIPFFLNPSKSIAGEYVLKTKLMGVKVHGIGHYLYFSTNQICHDSNFSVECLRRTILKLHDQHQGKLPRTLYIQSDNGPDMKSKQFIAFCAYLVEKGVFEKVKLSYLIVGHTHEDIDQYFSCISRYIKKTLKTILTVAEFVKALSSAFTTPGCIPKCIEEVSHCYDTSTLLNALDPYLARFNLNECTGDKVHYFVFRRNTSGKATAQYKLRRYSDALYPRKYNVGDNFVTELNDVGQVIDSKPAKDPFTKEKFWLTTVKFCGSDVLETFRLPANDCSILMFPHDEDIPTSFQLADFAGSVDESLGDQKNGINNILAKLEFAEKKPVIVQQWKDFWESRKDAVDLIDEPAPFLLPPPQTHSPKTSVQQLPIQIDDGVRKVDIVTYAQFTESRRKKAIRTVGSQIPEDQLDELQQGAFLVINLVPDNSPWYQHPFLIGQLINDVSAMDTTNADTDLQVQIYLPSDKNSLHKKFIKWQGDDGHYWVRSIKRGHVKGIVEFTKKGKKLTKPSLDLISSIHF